MNFLILGCNGMAGHMMSVYLKEQGHNVIGFARKKSEFVETIVGDARDFELLKTVITNNDFDAVINCIGILNKAAEDNKSDAVLLNSYLPHFLADITKTMRTKIIQISTDCVFSGKSGGYTEKDTPDGETFYDRTKALGELIDDKNITLRNSIIGPDINVNGIGLMNWFLKQNDSVKGFKKAIWTGQTTLQLAKTVERAACVNAAGLFNTVPDSSINKYDLLQLFNKYIRKDKIEIIQEENFSVDKSLIRLNYDGFDYKIPDYETMIIELAEWMKEHREMYPHYDIAG